MSEEQTFQPCWAIVEVFGHQRFAGLVGEQAIAGDKLLRLDIPAIPESRAVENGHYHPTTGERGDYNSRWSYSVVAAAVPGETKFFGVKAIYALTPVSEERARKEAALIATRTKTFEDVVNVPIEALKIEGIADAAPVVAEAYEDPFGDDEDDPDVDPESGC